jgi:hypothetical protein
MSCRDRRLLFFFLVSHRHLLTRYYNLVTPRLAVKAGRVHKGRSSTPPPTPGRIAIRQETDLYRQIRGSDSHGKGKDSRQGSKRRDSNPPEVRTRLSRPVALDGYLPAFYRKSKTRSLTTRVALLNKFGDRGHHVRQLPARVARCTGSLEKQNRGDTTSPAVLDSK